jgi:hypothetical protein
VCLITAKVEFLCVSKGAGKSVAHADNEALHQMWVCMVNNTEVVSTTKIKNIAMSSSRAQHQASMTMLVGRPIARFCSRLS